MYNLRERYTLKLEKEKVVGQRYEKTLEKAEKWLSQFNYTVQELNRLIKRIDQGREMTTKEILNVFRECDVQND
jgi:hypothetical protein